ncbi:MAG: YraN family protein [Cytophagales bacterium]|nr:YraN family protein [Cytophagales bacterium]
MIQKKESTKTTGDRGERIALNYLKSKGFSLLEKQYRYGRKEIDLIVSKEQLLVFAEIKSRKNNHFGYPEASVDFRKQEAIWEVAACYLEQHPWAGDIRYDIIAVTFSPKLEIVHFEDAF